MTRPEFTTRSDKAFSFAQEVPKQLLTLATAIFALTLTFAKDIEKPGTHARHFLEYGWIGYLVSILFGIGVLMALAGQIDDPPSGTDDDTIYSTGIVAFQVAQTIAFLAALVLTMIYGIKAT